jgi:hypothetical protein
LSDFGYSFGDLSGTDDTSIGFSAVPEGSYPSDAIPNITLPQSAFPSGLLDDPSASAVTTTANPPLSSASLSSLTGTGGAAGNTVIANPTVYSTGSGGTVASLSSLSAAVGQFGFGIASLLGDNSLPTTQAAKPVGYASAPSSSNSNMYLLLAIVAIVVVALVVMDE